MSDEKKTVRTVFGHELDVTEILGIDARELMQFQQGQLEVSDGDPGYVYVWLVANDTQTSAFVRGGTHQLVNPETDPVKCKGITEGGTYRINELVLARVPVDIYRKSKELAVARHLRREASDEAAYREAIARLAGGTSAEATGEASYKKMEKTVVRSRK